MDNLKMWRGWTSCAVSKAHQSHLQAVLQAFAYAIPQLSVISTDQRHLSDSVMQAC